MTRTKTKTKTKTKTNTKMKTKTKTETKTKTKTKTKMFQPSLSFNSEGRSSLAFSLSVNTRKIFYLLEAPEDTTKDHTTKEYRQKKKKI